VKSRPCEVIKKTSSEKHDSFAWIFRGNIVVPLGNPCLTDPSEHQAINVELMLGSALLLKLDHIPAVNRLGVIVNLEPAESFLYKIYVMSKSILDTLNFHWKSSCALDSLIFMYMHLNTRPWVRLLIVL
jgi:hypothetical protein